MLWYSLEFPWRGDSNEYPQHMFLWRTKENYPLIITKYPPYLFHWKPSYLLEPPHDKTNKMACVPSEASDQPGHHPSLIRVFTVHMKKPWVLSYPLRAQQRLWSDWAGHTVIVLVLSWGGSLADLHNWAWAWAVLTNTIHDATFSVHIDFLEKKKKKQYQLSI